MKLTRSERCALRALAADLRDCSGDLAVRLAPKRRWVAHLVRAAAIVAPYGCGTVYRAWPATDEPTSGLPARAARRT